MAAGGIRFGGENNPCLLKGNTSSDRNAHLPCSLSFSKDGSRCKRNRISMMAAKTGGQQLSKIAERKESESTAVVYEKMDNWMKHSVAEIVKNLGEAPLLVHVYDGETTTLKTEKAAAVEDWPVVMERWQKKEAPIPEGIIFVEQLEDNNNDNIEEDDSNGSGSVTRAWGIVVQGKGGDCGPICYLLKTSRAVGSGMGVCCTHFCLMRVRSFRETTRSQLKNCWLLQAQ